MAFTYTRPVYLSIFEKRSLQIFPCEGGFSWQALLVDGGEVGEKGPFDSRSAAKAAAKKYAEGVMQKRRSSGNTTKGK